MTRQSNQEPNLPIDGPMLESEEYVLVNSSPLPSTSPVIFSALLLAPSPEPAVALARPVEWTARDEVLEDVEANRRVQVGALAQAMLPAYAVHAKPFRPRREKNVCEVICEGLASMGENVGKAALKLWP